MLVKKTRAADPAFPFPAESLLRTVIQAPATLYNGLRKIVQDQTWRITGPYFRDSVLDYHDLNYGPAKAKQLERNYWNEDEAQRVRAILDKRGHQAFTSVAMSLRGQGKEARSMGWCMLSLVITRIPRQLESVEIQYRSTELVRKFGADLCFLPWVFSQLDLRPDLITFRFANAYLSGVYFPLLGTFWDPIDFYDYLWKHDQKLFACGTRFILRSAAMKGQSFPYAAEQRQHDFAWSHLDMPRIREYLHEKYRIIGKKLPTRHHPVEDDDDE